MNDPRLAELLRDAVADVEPADRIHEILARTANPARSAARPWFYAAGATVLATAAAVTAFAVLGDDFAPDSGHQHVMTSPTPAVETQLVPAYFLGDTPHGVRLYREFDTVPAGDPLQAALDRIQRPPSDPDYSTPWPHGSFKTATLGDATIDVEVGDAAIETADELAVQQVVYTLQGAIGEQLPVQFLRDGKPVGSPVDAAPQNDVLSLMSISDPAEGNSYHGSFTARGRANSFEMAVHWELHRGDETGKVVRQGSTSADGWQDHLYQWETDVDLSGLPYGFYTFVAINDDPSGGESVIRPDSDTRLITVQ